MRLDTCGELSPTLIFLPKRSRLFNLEPVGMGTAWVESLTSYIGRLADVHGVYVKTLIVREILPQFKRQYLLGGPKVAGTFWRKSVALNGTGNWARDCVSALETLTGRDDLCYLTMLTWSEVLSHRGLLRRTRAWCPFCLHDWRSTGEVVYEPLLWTLEVITACPKHNYPLCSVCPYSDCTKCILPLAPRTRLGYCSACARWLGLSCPGLEHSLLKERPVCESVSVYAQCCIDFSANFVPPIPVASRDGLRNQAWQQAIQMTYIGVAAMLCSAPRLRVRPAKDNIAANLRTCINSLASARGTLVDAGNTAEIGDLAQSVDLSRRSIRDMLAGRQLPQLATLLRICQRLGISLDAFSTTHLSGHCFDVARTNLRLSPKRRRRSRKHTSPRNFDKERLLHALEQAQSANEWPPPPMRAVASDLGYDASHLSKHFPKLCKAISAKYLNTRKSEGPNV
jgi:DNA-binding phage protein